MLGHPDPVKFKSEAYSPIMRSSAAERAAPRGDVAGYADDICVSGLDAMTEAKLWRNPCWLTYRLNYLALRYNVPLYSWVEQTYGLSRPEYVVIYSLGLKDGAAARDIAVSSGFPQNTLSRAIHKLVRLGLIERTGDTADRRRFVLRLSKTGRALFEDSLPAFVDFEHMMLEALSEDERSTLSRLMAKMVLASPTWPSSITGGEPSATPSGAA
jgi:MarR family transcriptional regulator, temperature-dependent positive regulator of motility